MSAPAESMSREEGFAHRGRGLVAGSGWGVGPHDQARDHRFTRKQNRPTGRSKRNTCLQRVFRFQPLFPSLPAGVRAAEKRRRKGST